MTDALDTVEEMEMLSVEELNFRLKRLRFTVPPSEPDNGGLVLRRELMDAAEEPPGIGGAPLSGVLGGEVDRVLPEEPLVSPDELPSVLLYAMLLRPP